MERDPYQYFRIEARELLDELGRAALELERTPQSAPLVAQLLRLAHTLKGAARVVKRAEIANSAHAIEDALVPFREGQSVPPERTDRVLKCLDEIAAGVAALGSAPGGDAANRASAPAEPAGALAPEADEVAVLLDGLRETGAALAALERGLAGGARVRELTAQLAAARPREGGRPGERTAAERLAPLRELQRLTQRLQQDSAAGTEQLGRELRQLRESAERLRFAPAARLFHSLERTARDAAQSLGKRVAFAARGGQVRIDPGILAAIQGALVQTVRNAVAHGLETEAERRGAGKAPEGSVCIEVTRRGGAVVFRCSDDGRGVDLESVRRAARRRQPAPPGLESLGAAELLQLLLAGGISTSGSVTEVAGRGVGLDVVREVAQRLGGRVTVETAVQRGTTFEITVPLSLAALEVLWVEAGGQSVALPCEAVRRALRLEADALARSAERVTLRFEDRAIPFAPLERVLGGAPPATRPGRWLSAVVVEHENALVALGVARVCGLQTVVWRPLPPGLAAEPVVAGTALDAQGEARLVLDAAGLVRAAARGGAPVAAAAPARLPILIVDDSLTTRMLEQSILESAGYTVELASCAEEGLEKAQRRRYALILTDVEMPGMDGFELVARLRADPALREIPVFLVTSRNAPEDRRRGATAGAQGYIVKSEFDQAQLLQSIRELVG